MYIAFGHLPTFRSDAPHRIGSLFTSARVVYAAAHTGQLPRAIGVLDADRGTPIRAVLLQAAITITLILLGGGFRALVRIAVVALWAFYFLTVRLHAFRENVLLKYRARVGFGRYNTPSEGTRPSSVGIFASFAQRCCYKPNILNHRPYRTWIITPMIFCAV